MRVTFLAPMADLSGGARVIDIHARALHARGHEVTVVILPHRKPRLDERLLSVARGGSWTPKLAFHTHYSEGSYALRYLDRRRPIRADDLPPSDVVIATWWETAQWLIDMPDSVGAKVHFVQHYEAFDDRSKGGVDAVLAAPTAKITISGWLDRLLTDDFGNGDVAVVPNGVDMTQFHAPPRGRQARFTAGLLYSSTPFKNVAFALSLFAALQRDYPDARLVAFGHHPEAAGLPLPAGAELHVQPAQDRLRDIYAACDVWLCASKAEGFHLPPLEAMACRCPVVSTPVGGPLDIVREGENGHLVPFDDFEAALARLKAIAAMDDAAWRRLSDGAHATARAATWDAASERFEQALVDAIARTGRRQDAVA